jgi:hypothetical protein
MIIKKKTKIFTTVFVTILALIGFKVSSITNIANAQSQDEMTFSIHRDCSNGCNNYILANGRITEDTPKIFEKFLKTNSTRGTVYFNSIGGNLEGGIKLGELIREKKLNTFIGLKYQDIIFRKGSASLKVLIKNPICYSSCAYAFLGGNTRTLAPNSQYGIHTFKSENSINNFFQTRLVDNYIKNYLTKMRINSQYFELAKETPPGEMYILTKNQARILGVDNTINRDHKELIDYIESGNVKVTYTDKKLTYQYSPFVFNKIRNVENESAVLNIYLDKIQYLLISKEGWRLNKNGSITISFDIPENFDVSLDNSSLIELVFPNLSSNLPNNLTFTS